MSIGVGRNDAQAEAREVVEYYGSPRHHQENEVNLLERFGITANDVEGTPEGTAFGRSEKLNSPVSNSALFWPQLMLPR